uniref:Uncharacterized protein n=2 Tax=Ditylum brightwellii TaxID=49249 RepID=A0A6V2DIK6_9STRA
MISSLMQIITKSLICLFFVSSAVVAFTPLVHVRFGLSNTNTRLSSTTRIPNVSPTYMQNDIASKFFDLKEMEDKENACTDIYLSPDTTVLVGETNGPIPKDAKGTWIVSEDGTSFTMKILRTYDSGKDVVTDDDSISSSGDFTFHVERTFTGEVSKTEGGTLKIEGSMHNIDSSLGDMEVGFFTMVDTSDDRFG